MARILFVTGSAGGVGVENLQHQGALRKSSCGSRIVLNSSLMRSATMILPRNNLRTMLEEKAVMLAQTKGHNRAVHPGEKSDKECEGIKVVCADLPIISTALCSVGVVNPHVIQLQLNQ